MGDCFIAECYINIMWTELCKFAALPSLFMLPSSSAGKLLHSSFSLLRRHMIKRETKYESSLNETNAQWTTVKEKQNPVNKHEHVCVTITQPI